MIGTRVYLRRQYCHHHQPTKSDSSLKLLVVPRDEDVLQMAYQNSAYNHGQEPYRGAAGEIPDPPPPVYGGGGVRAPQPGHRQAKPPLPPRYKSELKMVPEDDGLGRRTLGDGQPRWLGARASPSTTGSSSSVGSHSKDPLDYRDSHHQAEGYRDPHHPEGYPLQRSGGPDGGGVNGVSMPPGAPIRTSSKNIVLSHLGLDGHRSGSVDSISKSSESSASTRRSQDGDGNTGYMRRSAENVQLSSDNLSLASSEASGMYGTRNGERYRVGGMSRDGLRHSREDIVDELSGPTSAPPILKSVTTSRLPSAISGYRPTPTTSYGRSLTTSSLLSSSTPTEPKRTSPNFSSATYIKPYKPILASTISEPRTSSSSSDLLKSKNGSTAGPVSAHSSGSSDHLKEKDHLWSSSHESGIQYSWPDVRKADMTCGGPTVTVRIHDKSPQRQRSGSQGAPTVTITAGHSGSDRQINMVAERRKWFQSLDYPEGDKRGWGGRLGGDTSGKSKAQFRIEKGRGPPSSRTGAGHVDSVATRIASFEASSDDNISECGTEPHQRQRKLSSDEYDHRRRGSAEERENYHRSPQEDRQRRVSREDQWKERELQQTVSHKYTPQLGSMDETVPVLHVTPPPFAGSGLSMPVPFELVSAVMPEDTRNDPHLDDVDGSGGDPSVILRQQSSPEEREAKLVRRTSYLMATNRDRSQVAANAQQQHQKQQQQQAEMSKSDSQLRDQSSFSSLNTLSIAQIDQTTEPKAVSTPANSESVPSPKKSHETSERSKMGAGPSGERVEKKPEGLVVEMPKDPGSIPPDVTTPTKTSNIRKLKAFFGEKTPRIVEATTDRQRVFDMPASTDVVKEGMLSCKMAISDGKRASDRSWKPMWAVLRGHALYLFKDKTSVSVNSPSVCDEQPISIKSSFADIAYDYTKKKHVFRLTTYNGSEYLFQPDDHETMLDWISVIQKHNNPDDVSQCDKGVANKELIVRKTVEYEMAAKTSPQGNIKYAKKTSTKSLRSKSPASHSPSSFKQRKQAFEKEHVDSPKGKDSGEKKGTWKGKMAKRFRRHPSSVVTPAELNGTFGMPLELCCPSTFSEHVPLVVELCTRIVEARGIENQGIYRVPGNTGAVNTLQEELNKDPENMDMENDKWLDVNVVSSLLKLFFRKLPEPLITDDLYELVIAANRMDNPEKRMLHIKKILHDLPDANFETFSYIAGHLAKVANMGHVNKMDARNLAIVFGPTLIRSTDETLVTMVKDMSDQCRIVESVIMNHDWFFGSWDMDMYVPLDEPAPDAVPVTGMNQELLSKAKHLELGDRGRDISAKDIVTSIIGAANKIRRREKSSSRHESGGIVIEPESDSEPAYNERDIDREIELRGMKEQLASSTSSMSHKELSSQSLSSSTSTVQQQSESSSTDGLFTAKRVLIQRKDSETSATTTTESVTSEESMPLRLNRLPAYPTPDLGNSFSTENSKPVRRFSEDFLLSSSERHGDDEVDYQSYRSGRGMTYAAQQHLRRIAMETQALRQKEEERRFEQERHALEHARVELELPKTKSLLEREESIEDLIAKQNTDLMARIPDGSSKYSDYSSKADSTSIASDYSTTSSTAYPDNKLHSLHMQLGYVSDYSSSTSPISVHGEGTRLAGVHRPIPYGSSRGRYTGDDWTKSGSDNTKGSQLSRDDLEVYRQHPVRPIFDVNKVATKGTLVRKRSKSPTRTQQDQAGSSAQYGSSSLRQSGSLQRTGSLDSLRDFYDKPETNPYLSDSDNGDDLVESLTSTFDEKLKKLLDPKQAWFDQHPPNSKRTPPVGSESTQSSPSPRPLSHSTPTHHPTTESSRYQVSFQNPSLHRVCDGGGVGARSEQEVSPGAEHHDAARHATRSSDRWGAPTSLGLHRDLSPPGGQQKPGALVPEGTNTNLRRWERGQDDYAAQLRKSSEKLYGSRECMLDLVPVPNTDPAPVAASTGVVMRTQPAGSEPRERPDRPRGITGRSVSPPACRRDATQPRRVQRRHTVGGSSDYDHLAALAAVNQGQGGTRRSAWDRLQPAVSPTEGEAKSIRAWCEKERLRTAGSSPAILGLTIQPAPDRPLPTSDSIGPTLPPRDPPDPRLASPGGKSALFQRSMSQPPPSVPGPTTPYSVGAGARGSRTTFTFESSI